MKLLHREVTRDAEPAQAPKPVHTGSGRRILIVEDNYFVAHQCEAALLDAGFDVIGVIESGEQAVDAAAQRRPDLVLMDIYLPGKLDGIDAATEIFRRLGIPSVFASALADPAVKARAASARPVAWLVKPFNDRKLVATVETALRELPALSDAQP